MNKTLSSTTSTNSVISNGTKPSSCVMSKLRRLKIEENIMLQDLQKFDGKNLYEITEPDIINSLDTKNMLKNLRDSYHNVKNLFDDVQTVTCSQELLAELEIEDIKKKVFELETTLKSFKTSLNSELNSLKIAEHVITKQLEDIRLEAGVVRKRSKTLTKNYNQAVPSPVRLLMTSPFKCSEVEEFQNFMKNSPNRCGGWNEYHHNIFVKYWQKYFGNTGDVDPDESFVGNVTFKNFVEETLIKLQGIDEESIMSHIEWYKKYLVLKDQQQKAIDKWKSNRRLIKSVPEKMMIKNLENKSSMIREINYLSDCRDEDDLFDFDQTPSKKSQFSEMKKKPTKQTKKSPKVLGQDDIERLSRPTKQWLSRNYEIEQKDQATHFIENLEKLRIPYWRQYLV